MRIVIVGAGSIGARHAAIAAAGAETAVFDLDMEKAQAVARQTGTKVLKELADVTDWRADGAVVAVPAEHHAGVAGALLERGIDVLVEKPIAHDAAQAAAVTARAEALGRRLFVACNMRFHPAVQLLRAHLEEIGEPRSARAYYGNWLPAMRPGVDYRTLYCADAGQGGALLDGIHEVDYLAWLFGPVTGIQAQRAHLSELEISADDYAALLLRHASGVRSEVHLDYLQRCKRRGCEVIGSRGTLLWESRGKLPEACRVECYTVDDGRWRTLLEGDIDNAGGAYERQFAQFLGALRGEPAPDLLDAATACSELDVVLTARRAGGLVQ